MLLNTSTRACRAKTWSGCMIAVLLLISILAAPAAWAHVDPPGSNATGIGISLTAFRSDRTTPVLPGTISQCETIYYRATLSWAGGSNAAFEGGAWSITTPDGAVHDVTPVTGIPCVGGTFDDPLSGANGGRGLCSGASASINSALVPYTASILDIVGGSVGATTALTSAYAHISSTDQFGVGANTPFPLSVELCDDGLFCNGDEVCDATGTNGSVTGICVDGTAPVCDNGLFCDGLEICDEGADSCAPGTAPVCDNGLFCDGLEICDEGLDECAPGTAPVCDNGLFCDGLEICDEGLDECAPGTAPVCDNGLFCDGLEICDEGLDECAPGTAPVCDNGLFCDGLEICDEGLDECAPGTSPDCAALGDECNDGLCDEVGDTCYTEPLPPETAPDVCFGEEICRTPGFWGTHGGTEKKNSTNITQAVIDEAGGLLVCGESITDTHLGHTHSALEAICVSVKGAQELQLARQLTAAALNCVMSGGPADCTGISIEELYADCNVACVGGDSDRSITECIEEVDCFNNGGEFVAGECKTGVGTCDVSGAACDDDTPCTGLGDTMCVPFETCHDRDLCPDFTDDGELNGSDFCFEPPGAAGSSGACNAATKNTLSIFD